MGAGAARAGRRAHLAATRDSSRCRQVAERVAAQHPPAADGRRNHGEAGQVHRPGRLCQCPLQRRCVGQCVGVGRRRSALDNASALCAGDAASGRVRRRPVVLVEGEIDALTVVQACGALVAAVASGSTAGPRRGLWWARLALAPCVLVAFDDDAPSPAPRTGSGAAGGRRCGCGVVDRRAAQCHALAPAAARRQQPAQPGGCARLGGSGPGPCGGHACGKAMS